ncbi:RICIN domain-containing protein [Streptosporangium sp. NPDC000396]|uniref:RICIN domain-containing protein n=1 Tax=Streptosporangium sp. NPDC000396 TaxID=3366185 RepID=UPI0036AC67F4
MNRGPLLLAASTLLATVVTASPAAAETVRYYEVVVEHSGKCLDVQDASRAHGADVIQGKCLDGYNQQWSLVPVGGGYYKLVARHSGKCLDVQDASPAHGANVLQATCSNEYDYNQQWRMRSVSGPKWPGTGTPFQLRARHSDRCLDVQDASYAHGANVLQATCSNGANQRWRLRTP